MTDTPYPSACERYDEPESAWRLIDSLLRSNIAYNLLYLPGTLYVLPRRMQGSYRLPAFRLDRRLCLVRDVRWDGLLYLRAVRGAE